MSEDRVSGEELSGDVEPAGPVTGDFWKSLRRATPSRIGLGRSGDALPTRRVLELGAAHAAARDAVHEPLDVAALAARLTDLGLGRPAIMRSRASGRGEYLRRPDLGRLPASLDEVERGPYDVGFVLADGLSPRALAAHGPGLLLALVGELAGAYTLSPPVVATQARVALADHVGQALGATTLVLLIGERPGLTVSDSLGVYLTHDPRPGRTDAERNCVSNVHPPGGLGYAEAARVLAGLVAAARHAGRSGVTLKDTSSRGTPRLDP